ncbi:MAG: hypothetical protein N0E58_17465 [Candidatus Thiodiazotropha endolucinida]|uniref:Uncharacterized protein n=1 Tax=Candidatus Thiodiazotropha taylori TaxID=2792791 RepID=A0A9E4NMB1_9GAMM|nr:hypothetical protein [Candidatus Thiodiazotropha taylori]MCW4238037.1 hypothetical protein [Candidatus Thiodiazotropha endolucinida]
MAIFQAGNAGACGVIKDQHPALLPGNAWTYADGIRFESDAAVFTGEAENLFGATRPVGAGLMHVLPVGQGETLRYVGVGVHGAEVFDGQGHRQSLRVDEALCEVSSNGCTSMVFGGLPLLNIEGCAPLMWSTGKGASRLTVLPKWPPNQLCKSLRCYHNYLIALNLSKSQADGDRVDSPYKVMWSNLARPNRPPDWSVADPTSDAGALELSEGRDEVVDGLTLGEQFFVYKSHSTWQMDWVGGEWIFHFRRRFSNLGALGRNCVVAIERQHFVLSDNDVVLHDGMNIVSVLSNKVRRWLFRHLNEAHRSSSFVYHNPASHEVFVFFPMDDSAVPNMAVVYNYRTDTAAIRTFEGGVHHAASVPVAGGVLDNVLASGAGLQRLAATSAVASGSKLERIGLTLGALHRRKLVKRITPLVDGEPGGKIRVSVGAQSDPWSPPAYRSEVYEIGQTFSVPVERAGRYFGVKFENLSAGWFRLNDYLLAYQETGEW